MYGSWHVKEISDDEIKQMVGRDEITKAGEVCWR